MKKETKERNDVLMSAVKEKVDKMAPNLEIIYRILDWHWRDNPTTPTKEEISKTMLELASDVIKRKSGSTGTGGLHAEWDKGERSITVSFSYDGYVYSDEVL